MVDGEARVEVVYAETERQDLISLPLREGMTAREAVELSGLLAVHPEIACAPLVLGIYGTRVELDYLLAAGDRVEICRPLEADPRQMRRSFVAAGRVMGGADLGAPKKRDPE